jgi:competence protein ComEC
MTASHIAMHLSGYAMEAVLQMIYFFAEVPWAAIKTFVPTSLEIVAYYALLGALLLLLKMRGRPHAVDYLLKNRCYQLTFIVIVLFFAGDVAFWWQQRFRHDDLKISIIDVGQGNAALVEFPGGACMLIDGGGFSDQSVFDVGKNILAPFLLHKRILTIDTIVLTHPDCDHLNGLLYIMQHFDVQSVWSNHQAADSLGYRKFVNIINKKQLAWPDYRDLKRHLSYGQVNLDILYPAVDYFDKMKHQKWRNTNNNSLVLKISLHDFSILFPGDIMRKGESDLALKRGNALKSNVLIAPHHGSKSSSTALFLHKVDPEMVIVSCGWMNRFHFPHDSVLQRYQQNGYDCLRTDIHGAVMLTTNGHQLKIASFGNDDGSRWSRWFDFKNDSMLTLK